MVLHSNSFFEKFTVKGTMNETGKDFTGVKEAFLERFAKKEEPQFVIREATDVSLNKKT